MSVNRCYYTSDPQATPDKVKHYAKKKFEPKVMLWIAISPKGMSDPVLSSGKSMSVTANTYINECLKPRLIPFINSKYPREAMFFGWIKPAPITPR